MFLETVPTEGLGHLSYVFGAEGEAAVVDPRRDCAVYEDIARRHGARITTILETHRNEDYVHGSKALAARTGADILHGAALPFAYGHPVRHGDRLGLGTVEIQVLETPGHTDESLSFAVHDLETGREPVAVFTGDALFVGDVGRTDFYPDRAREVAGLLHDSLHGTLLLLGDHVTVLPAHGAGSVCGAGMAERRFSTLGYERRTNPMLQLDREAFIAAKLAEAHLQPPYFARMEELNIAADPLAPEAVPAPQPLDPAGFAAAREAGALVLDVRAPEAFLGAHIPGSLHVPEPQVPGQAGWLLPYNRDILLVGGDDDHAMAAARHLMRIGYDRVTGMLAGGRRAWERTARPITTIPAVQAGDLETATGPPVLLDVRDPAEQAQDPVDGALTIPFGLLDERMAEVPGDRPVVAFCSTGQRATVAAARLRRHGLERVTVCLGPMGTTASR